MFCVLLMFVLLKVPEKISFVNDFVTTYNPPLLEGIASNYDVAVSEFSYTNNPITIRKDDTLHIKYLVQRSKIPYYRIEAYENSDPKVTYVGPKEKELKLSLSFKMKVISFILLDIYCYPDMNSWTIITKNKSRTKERKSPQTITKKIKVNIFELRPQLDFI